MSQAFVKEEDGQWLHDVPPTMNALINYLTRENNGVRVYEQKTYFHPKEKTHTWYFITTNNHFEKQLFNNSVSSKLD